MPAALFIATFALVLTVRMPIFVAGAKAGENTYSTTADGAFAIVTSSQFPFYARNMGTGEPIKNATRMLIQKNTIFHDAKNPSRVKFRVLR